MLREQSRSPISRQKPWTAAVVSISILGCIAGLSLLLLRQTILQNQRLFEAQKDFESTQNALRADLLRQIDETDGLREQIAAAQRERKGLRQKLAELLQQQQTFAETGKGSSASFSPDEQDQPEETLRGSGQSVAPSTQRVKGGVQLPAAAVSSFQAAPVTITEEDALAWEPGDSASRRGFAAAQQGPASEGLLGLSRKQSLAASTAATTATSNVVSPGKQQPYPNVANAAYGSLRTNPLASSQPS